MVFNGSISDVQWTSEWIQCTKWPNIVWQVNNSLVFLSNGSIGSIEHHWTCPLDIVSNGHNVQWKRCPMDTIDMPIVQWCPMDPMDTMDILDKNIKLMFTRQTRFGDCVQWIHSDGSIGILIEHRKWFHGSIEHHWTNLPMEIMSSGRPLD